MRATITRYLETLKKRRASDEGFSLIELIVVVAILGILVAIAIPVFGGIQQNARDNALATAAASGATTAATAIAGTTPPADATALTALLAATNTLDYAYTAALTGGGTAPTLGNFCVTATAVAGGSLVGGVAGTSGPGC